MTAGAKAVSVPSFMKERQGCPPSPNGRAGGEAHKLLLMIDKRKVSRLVAVASDEELSVRTVQGG